MPHVTFWLTNPERRNYAFYTGIGFPFYFQSNNWGLQTFLGGRFFLDINKALLIEVRYTNYRLQVNSYQFNSYGNALMETIDKEFKKVLVNLGLQICF